MTRVPGPLPSESLRRAIRSSGRSLRSLAKATGIDLGSLSRFTNGLQGLRLEAADRLAVALGLELVPEQGALPEAPERALGGTPRGNGAGPAAGRDPGPGAPSLTHTRASAAELPGRLRAARKARGLTLEQAADELGVAPETLSRFERGTWFPGAVHRDRVARWLA